MDPEILKTMITFIDIMASRGAIKGEELESVGKLRAELIYEVNKDK